MGLQRFPLSDFRGGLNTRDGPFALDGNEAQALLNVTLTRRGILDQRPGKTQFGTDGFIPSLEHADHLRVFYKSNGAKFLMASINGKICSFSTAATGTLLFNGTPGSVWCFEQLPTGAAADQVWCVNGVDPGQKWDGVAAGTSAWTTAPTTLGLNGVTVIRVWKNRMLWAGITPGGIAPHRVWYSDIGNPEAVQANNFLDIRGPEDDLDAITWLEVVGDYLVVFKRRSTWATNDTTLASSRRLGTPGCEGRFQSAVMDGKAYFFSRLGVYSTDGVTAPEYESSKVEPTIRTNLNAAVLDKVRMFAARDRRLFAAWPFGSSTYNNRLWEFIPDLRATENTTEGAWTIHDLPVASACTFRPVDTEFLVAGTGATNRIHKLFDGLNDDGAAIDAYWTSAWRSFISEEPKERLRRLNLEMTGRVQVDVYRDLNLTSKFSQVREVTSTGEDAWDGSLGWDELDTWDPSPVTDFRRVRPESHGRYHAVRLGNNVLNKTFSIYALEAAIRGGKEH